MQFLLEFLPVLLFFLAFKFYNIYVATVVGIVATSLQVVISRCLRGVWDNKQLVTLGVFVFFGSLTLYFHNPIFVKWKPTIVFWVFAIIILGSHFLTQRPLSQRLMGHILEEKGVIPTYVWRRVNLLWAAFFTLLGAINLYIAYNFSNDTWVNFKFYGITGALLFLSLLQAFYLMQYMDEHKQ